ncbi:hypothetical protein HanRHA438_Chr09g0420071 [Helianthus annuus]|nr:hypothetical protein HanOQP8_Chr09g0339671 [Helianthus annuus]KAJ0890108.1 hypothetical protein HanRHA438_Chr09g0420071 [Helianthus annuus]
MMSTVVDDDDVQLEMFNFRWTRFRFQGRGLVKHVFTRSRFSCGSGDYLGSVHTGSVKTSQTGQWFGSVSISRRFGSWFGLTRSHRVNSVNSASQPSQLSQCFDAKMGKV